MMGRRDKALAALSIVLALVPSIAAQQPCSIARNRLEPGSWAFTSDCGPTAFCATNRTCVPRTCRTSDWPFGCALARYLSAETASYASGSTLPPKCSGDRFCPDEGSGCLSPSATGGPCQLDRDDQCLGSARCLNFVCTGVNATLNNACIVENTVFTGYATDGSPFPFIVSRDNCVDGLYCDGTSRTCLTRRSRGSACAADKQCLSGNCDSSGTCSSAIGPKPRSPIYATPLVVIAVVVALLAIYFALNARADRVTLNRERTEQRFFQTTRDDWHRLRSLGLLYEHSRL